MRSRRVLAALACTSIAIGLPAAIARSAPTTKPPTGSWVFGNDGRFELVRGSGGHLGSLYLRHISASSDPSYGGCPPKAVKLSVAGRLKLGSVTSGGYSSWAVGTNKKASNQVDPIPVTIVAAGKRTRGGFAVTWDYSNVRSIISVVIVWNGCRSEYFPGHPKR